MFEQLMLIGNLGKDPEMRYTSAGVAVTTFPVAVNRKWTNQDGTPGEETTWFRVTAWRKLAETCSQYLAKGRQVLVVGRVTASAYMGQDGKPKASLEVTAESVRFLGGKNGNGVPGAGQGESEIDIDEEEIPF